MLAERTWHCGSTGLRELSLLGHLQSVLRVVYMFVSQEAPHRSPYMPGEPNPAACATVPQPGSWYWLPEPPFKRCAYGPLHSRAAQAGLLCP